MLNDKKARGANFEGCIMIGSRADDPASLIGTSKKTETTIFVVRNETRPVI